MASRGQNSTAKTQRSELKQKSLMAFFGKAKATASTASKSASNTRPMPQEANEDYTKPSHPRSRSQTSLTSDTPALPETPPKKGSQSSAVGSATYTHTSNGISSGRDTPPTSDPIDIDMMSIAEDEEDDGDDAWEDEDDEESRAAVDRVLAKYEKAKVADNDQPGDFDARYEQSMIDKMDEWKRNYYKVCL